MCSIERNHNDVNRRNTVVKRSAFTALLVVLAAAAGSAGVLLWRTLNPPALLSNAARPATGTSTPSSATDREPALAVGERRPDFSLADTQGISRSVAEWDGKLLIINFWATWCPPCLEEIPAFVRLQKEYGAQGVQFLGVALDSAENVRRFITENAVNYPSLHGQRDAIELGKRYGNSVGALPYTVVVSRDGSVLASHHGLFDESALRQLIDTNR